MKNVCSVDASARAFYPLPTLFGSETMSEETDNVQLCIIGAGVAGVGIADALSESAIDVTFIEKSRGVGGRAATRRKNGCRYEHGANYIKNDPAGNTKQLIESLGEGGLVDIDEPIWTFDADGDIQESDRQEDHKWTWKQGITQFSKRILARTHATVEQPVRAQSLNQANGRWTVTDTDDAEYGPFDAVVFTPPAPQTATLLAETTVGGEEDDRLVAAHSAVEGVSYRSVRTFILHYPFAIDRDYYAVVNRDKAHSIGWLARESCKDDHVPEGEELLVVQMGNDWSEAHYDEPREELAPVVAEMVAELLDDDALTEPDWVDEQGWRYAQPEDSVTMDAIEPLAEIGLYAAGDWVVGHGRAHKAYWNGVELGEQLSATL